MSFCHRHGNLHANQDSNVAAFEEEGNFAAALTERLKTNKEQDKKIELFIRHQASACNSSINKRFLSVA